MKLVIDIPEDELTDEEIDEALRIAETNFSGVTRISFDDTNKEEIIKAYKECKDSMTRQELMNECDMLKGNINRMMVTDDLREMISMYEWAYKRLSRIYNERRQMFANKEQEK